MGFPQASAEIGQTFHSNPPHTETLRGPVWEVFPFQFCPKSSMPRKRTSGGKPLALFSPRTQKLRMGLSKLYPTTI
jgi:hypothetical protein